MIPPKCRVLLPPLRPAGPSLGYFKGRTEAKDLVLHQGGILYVKNPGHNPGAGGYGTAHVK